MYKNVNIDFIEFMQLRDSLFPGMPLKQRKQTILNENDMIKNSNWKEADQLAIYRACRRI